MLQFKKQQDLTSNWFRVLRDDICNEFGRIEQEYISHKNISTSNDPVFKRNCWKRDGGGGGEISIMKGNVFEKVGVNISTVFGKLSDKFRDSIPGTRNSPRFWASGISVVAHMVSPLVPAVHMNTRYICTSTSWFGGGADLNPIYNIEKDTDEFHRSLKTMCDKYNKKYYPNFKKKCDEYFYIKHRNEARGVGGIFYDYHNSGNFVDDFNFTKDVGSTFLDVYLRIVRSNMLKNWSEEQREYQLIKRGRYVEFNLLYDRGTKFGLMTNGNPDAILMSLPPEVKWN